MEPVKVEDTHDFHVLTPEIVTAGPVSQSNSSVKVKSKVLASKLNPVNCHKKLPKKVAEKVRIDNLQEAELQALLDEVVSYRGKKDGTELFQALLRETQESGEESPPAFRPTQNTLNPSAASAQQRRRRSRKESSGPFSSGTPPSVQSNSVAGSNRKGGSLQNISSSHSQSEWGGLRRRNRHDTSDSGSALSGSPRKREGGSLPCDVARGTSRKKTSSAAVASAAAADENNSCVVTGLGGLQGCRASGTDSASDIDCVINMEGVMEDRSGEDRFPESWNLRLDHSENSTSTASGTIEPMEQDMELSPVEATAGQSTRLISKPRPKEPAISDYGTISGIAFEEVDSAIPFSSLSGSHLDPHNRISPMLNGMTGDEGHLFQRRQRRDVDENGNPFAGSATINGPSSNPLLHSRSSSSMLNPINTTIVTHSSASSSSTATTTLAGGPKATSRLKGKKKSKDGNVLVIEDLPGFVGNKDVDELLEYIESSEGNGGSGKKATEKKSGPKHNGTLPKESTVSASQTVQKVKPKGAVEKKNSSSVSTPTTKSLPRQTDSAYQPDSDDSDSIASSGTPGNMKKDTYVFRTGSAGAAADGLEEFEAAVAAAAAADFQTVTKRQKRKKRNSLSNSTAGSIKAKELLEQQSHMTPLFNNSSSPSVMMRPPRHPNHQSGSAHGGPGGMQVIGSSGGAGGGVGTGAGGDGIKKLVASVPPSEPSDLESDGDDSVHSLPVQPSAPLFPPPPLHQPPPPLYHAPPPFFNHNPISYADIMRSEKNAEVSFLAESSSVMPNLNATSVAEIQPSLPPKCSPITNAVAPVASTSASLTAVAANVPSNRMTTVITKSTPSGVPLRRAASLPPTSPSVETPPVVIVGSSSSTQVDVTFGFELNEQLLALSMQPQPARPVQSRRPVVYEPIESSVLPEFGTTPEPTPTPPTPPSSSPSSPQEASTPSPTSSAAVDFASRYRERPELLTPPDSRRSYEIVDFISQAWKRIERKLGEQQHGLGTNGSQMNAGGGVLQQTGIRVYTLE